MDLTPFEGRPVIATTVAITKAGDGLSAALAIDPIELEQGDEVFVVMRTKVGSIRFDPVTHDGADTGQSVRKHTLEAQTVTIVDFDVIRHPLEEQEARIKVAQEAADAAKAEAKAEAKRLADEAKGIRTLEGEIDPDGEGGAVIPLGRGRKDAVRLVDCDSCGGTGARGRGKCSACKGEGKVPLIAEE